MDGKALEMKTVADYQLLLNMIAAGHVIVYRAANHEAFEKDEGIDPDRHLRFAINCGDTFMYACADFTEFDLEDIREIAEMHEKFPGVGLTAWCARDRDDIPIKELLTDEYYKAYEYAGKFFAPSYDYILICSAGQVEKLRGFLGDIGYTVKPVGKQGTRRAFFAHLTEKQYHQAWRYAGCIYRYYGGTRIKSIKHEYFQDGDGSNSVFDQNRTAASIVGLDYSFRFRYHDPKEVAANGKA